MIRSRRPILSLSQHAAGCTGLALAALVLIASPLPLEARFLGTYLLLVVLPGTLLVRIGLGPAGGRGLLERVLLVLAAGYSAAMLLGLTVYTAARMFGFWQIIVYALGLNLALLVVARWREPGSQRFAPALTWVPRPPSPSAALARLQWPPLIVLAIAAGLRLTDLGWSEFQGDEARVLLRSMAALQGLPDALAAHRKVPGEILLTLVFYGQLGAITELVGRLPFVVAGLAGVLAFYELSRRLFGRRVGLLAASLLAVNGYFVAFGRILQYDSLAFFLGTMGLLCCLRFGETGQSGPGLAFLGSLFIFGAMLAALGAVFFLPPALILAAPGLKSRLTWSTPSGQAECERVRAGSRAVSGRNRGVRKESFSRLLLAWCWPAAPAVLAGILVLGVGGESAGVNSQPGPAGIWSYLGPRLGGGRPYFNLEPFLMSANHYLSTPYLALVLASAIAAILLAFDRALRQPRLAAAALTTAVVLAAVWLIWGHPRAGLALAAGMLVLLLLTASHESRAWRTALAWAAGPLLFHLFMVRFPGTHWREAFPGLVLLGSALAISGARQLPGGAFRLICAAALGLFIVGSAHYTWVVLVQRWPEYQMVFPQQRHPLDWTSLDGRRIGGVFGVSHRHGWKALAVLDAEGKLQGSYATNDGPAIPAWYMRRPQGCPEPPAFVFRTPRAPQDRGLLGPIQLPPGYVPAGHVLVEGRSTITILVAPGGPELGVIDLESLDDRFDRERTSPWLPVNYLYLPDLGAAAARRDCRPA